VSELTIFQHIYECVLYIPFILLRANVYPMIKMNATNENEKIAKIDIPLKRADAQIWLLGFKEIKENWLTEVKAERTGSEKTANIYLDIIALFCRYMNMTPAEIVAKGTLEVRKEATGDLQRKTWADQTSLAFFTWLQTQKGKCGKLWTRTRAKTAYGTVRSFLRYNGFTFKGKTPIAQTQTHTKLPSNEQLASAWKIATFTQKLAVGILRSTLWRPEDALTLAFGDLQEQYDPKRFYIEKVTEKEQLPVGVYLTAETTELVRLDMRKRFGNEIPKDAKILDYNYNALLGIVQRFGESVGLKLSPKYFRKMGRTRCAPIIGQDALFKMAGWALPGVGRNYMLPSPEDTLKSYLRIEALLTFEPKAVSDKDQQIENLLMGAIAQGLLAPEKAAMVRNVWRIKALSPEQVAVEIAKMKKQLPTQGGGLNFQQQASDQFAKILLDALKQVKQEMNKT